MHKTQEKAAQATNTFKFFDWAYNKGDQMAAELEYVALPDSVKQLVRAQWAEVRDASGKVVAWK
jgi:phosphate transport system substrate-binding protein